MNSQVITIVFSSNESYAKYLSVAIQSIVECADKERFYRIVVFYADMSSDSIKRLQGMSTECISIVCFDVNDEWKHIESVLALQNNSDKEVPCAHISKETYFHIFAPKLLHEEEFIIYSDCDVVFLHDPAKLIEDIKKSGKDAVIYGVRNYSSIGTKVYVEKHLKLSVENYINGGMFVIDIKRAQKEKWSDICESLLHRSSEFLFVDQDMLNIAISNIKEGLSLLDSCWDFQWHPVDKSLLNMCKCTKEDFIKARKNPYMIHFTSASKPWKEPYKEYADYFWRIAKKSPFYSQLLLQKMDSGPEIYENSFVGDKRTQPKVSVIIPAYNAGETVERCVESVINQSIQEVEIICIDDGSTDNTFEVLKKYLKGNNFFKIIKQKQSGAAVARNIGIKKASGKYLYFIDSDDYIATETLKILFDNAEQNKSDVVICDAFQVNQDGDLRLPNAYLFKKYIYHEVFSPLEAGDHLFLLTGASVWNKLYSADYIKSKSLLFQQLDAADDTFFSMLSLAFANRISVCDDRLIYHTINNQNSQMNTIERFPLNQSKALMTIKQVLTEYGLFKTFEHSFVNRAALNSIKTLSRIKTYSIFKRTYQKYREELFAKLGIIGKPKDYFFRDELYMDIQTIIDNECDTDAFEKRKNYCSISWEGNKK